ncbi:PKD domain-containing protein [Aquimarina sp. AU58]|uniref:PKD domain-containing protein n=1 Tax=Aquimarina sp. AU58 TaxID=1874112 RepID=UPI00135AD41D|nr:PKD domain-containing protein [Aquimarina sp. AU58]
MIKKILLYSVGLVLISCAKETAIPVTVNFDFEVAKDDYSVPVKVLINNKTEGAELYEWHFEGGEPSSSNSRNPGVISYTNKGEYVIELTATNQDGSSDTKSIPIQVDEPIYIGFEATNLENNFSPAAYTFKNTTTGANQFYWTFEGGVPENSTKEDPGQILFKTPGEHKVKLEASSDRESYNFEKTIKVSPYLDVDFTYTVAYNDDDYQVPVHVSIEKTAISATIYQWDFPGAIPSTSNQENPEEVVYTTSGTYTIAVTASNGKEVKTITKKIEVFKNTNLRTFSNIKLGINTAHLNHTIGSFYSIADRRVYTANEIDDKTALTIDLVYYGFSNSFSTNRFTSPDDLSDTTFPDIENAKKTKFINSQESCNCNASLTALQFDTMEDDTLFQNLIVDETPDGLKDFDNSTVPRIVLFQTQEGKKGAIKIKKYVEAGQESYILIDIKVQKEAQ